MTITVTDRGRVVKLRWRGVPGLAVVGALVLTACAPDDDVARFTDEQQGETGSAEDYSDESEGSADEEEDTETEADDLSAGADDVLVAEVDDPVTFEECEEAEDADDATVTWMDDVIIEEEEIAATVESRVMEVDGEEIEISSSPAIVVPERIGQAGCLIEYDAPGACLPAVEISDSYIPGYRVPGRELQGVELPEGEAFEHLIQEELSAEAEEAEGARQGEVCQLEDEEETTEGGYVSAVYREAIYRSAIYQDAQYMDTQYRSTIYGDGWSASGDNLPGYSVPGTSVSGASIAGDMLEGYQVSDHTERSGEDESVSYTTEGDVLFDSSEYELRSDAESELQAVADDIAERDDDFIIKVEGHTDDVPVDPDQDFSDNDELSELRAESVAQWLTDNAGVDEGDITAEGLGEDHPRADNDTDEGRQLNRRVVITVQPEDYESNLDYELEEGEGED